MSDDRDDAVARRSTDRVLRRKRGSGSLRLITSSFTFSTLRRRLRGISGLALYGAFVATLSFGWQIFQFVSRRPVLNIDRPQSFGLMRIDNGPIRISNKTRVWNTGTKPVTVFRVDLDMSLRRASGSLIPFTIMMKTDRGQFPFKLDEGESKTLQFRWEYEDPKELDPSGQYEICGGVHVATTSGNYDWPEQCVEALYGDLKSGLPMSSHNVERP
jgi:hypothetical protein